MRLIGLARSLLIGFLLIGAVTEANAERPPASQHRMYVISVRLLKTMPNGEERELSCPTIATVEDRVAEFQSGIEIRPPEGVELEEPLRDGTNHRIRVFRNKGRLFLEVRGSVTNVSRQDAEGVRIAETGLSIVESLTLGQKIVVPVPGEQKSRWEILVQEAKPEQAKKPEGWAEGLMIEFVQPSPRQAYDTPAGRTAGAWIDLTTLAKAPLRLEVNRGDQAPEGWTATIDSQRFQRTAELLAYLAERPDSYFANGVLLDFSDKRGGGESLISPLKDLAIRKHFNLYMRVPLSKLPYSENRVQILVISSATRK